MNSEKRLAERIPLADRPRELDYSVELGNLRECMISDISENGISVASTEPLHDEWKDSDELIPGALFTVITKPVDLTGRMIWEKQIAAGDRTIYRYGFAFDKTRELPNRLVAHFLACRP